MFTLGSELKFITDLQSRRPASSRLGAWGWLTGYEKLYNFQPFLYCSKTNTLLTRKNCTSEMVKTIQLCVFFFCRVHLSGFLHKIFMTPSSCLTCESSGSKFDTVPPEYKDMRCSVSHVADRHDWTDGDRLYLD